MTGTVRDNVHAQVIECTQSVSWPKLTRDAMLTHGKRKVLMRQKMRTCFRLQGIFNQYEVQNLERKLVKQDGFDVRLKITKL